MDSQFAELINRGWNQADLSLLAGGNILRVIRGMEAASARIQKERGPSYVHYDKRKDLDGQVWPPHIA